MMWEEDLSEKYNVTLLPKSFKSHKYPFLQVRLPQHPE